MNKGKQVDKRNFLLKGWEIFGDIFMINVMFVLCSLPIFTIGASLCALYAVSIKLVNREDGSITKSFIREFKRNFKQGTIAWIVVMLAIVAIWGELLYIANFGDVMTKIYTVVVVLEIVGLALVLPFLFPLIARYENTLWNTIRNAFLLSISNLGKWLKVFLAWFAPIALSILEPALFFNTWYLWLLIAFGLIGYGTSHSILVVFERVSDVKEEDMKREEIEQEKRNTHGAIRKRAMMGAEESEE
ncbi:MAG: DUF624 domain-containing protein [Lachnospiraceae bacterium]|nr:DUF624 domain-containing protein [Lachnospiraceae bacterium]